MINISAYGKIEEGGKLVLHSEKRFRQDLKECKPCEIELIIKKRGRMSTPQRGYYHGVVVEEIRLRLKDLGHRMNHDQTHEFLKTNFNPQHLADEHGEVIATFAGSTTDFNKSMMAEYIDRIITWAATAIDCHIPPADKSLSMNF